MPIVHRALSDDEVLAGLILLDRVLFRRYFFADDLSLPPSREQKLMWCDASDHVLYCTGRKIAKTIDLEATVLQHGATRVGEGVQECLFFTPSDVHMVPVLDRLWARVERLPLFKLLISEQRRGENTILRFHSGVLWYFRIEGLSGTDRNVIGLRAARLVGDEQAYGNLKVYYSLLQTALPDAVWKLAGVPNGVRQSTLYTLDQTDQGRRYSRHNYSTFINPLYADPQRQAQLVEDYGGVETQNYVTQVLGQWGEEMTSSFPPGSFIDTAPAYFAVKLSALRPEALPRLPLLLHVPSVRCQRFAIGWDYGFSPDPSEILVAINREADDVWETYFRLQLRRTPLDVQVECIRYIITTVCTGAFVGLSTDKLEAVHKLQDLDPVVPSPYLWASPAGSTEVDVARLSATQFSVYHGLSEAERAKQLVKVPNKLYYHGLLKDWLLAAAIPLAGRKLILGRDGEMIDELIATVERKSSATNHLQYFGPPDPNTRGGMLDHIRDALSYLCDAIARGAASARAAHSEAKLLEAMGWAGKTAEGGYKAPWERA